MARQSRRILQISKRINIPYKDISMAVIEIAKIQVRRGQELQTGIPQLDPGEFAWAEDTEHLYIGKRIAEGANSDANTRILTEDDRETLLNDLGQVFRDFLHGGTDANTSTYQYRSTSAHIHSTGTTVSIKLDTFVNLTDYGVDASSTATDVTAELRAAIDDIFKNSDWNDWQRQDARRKLVIPAGNYEISSTIELPPYTTLIGEGPELTSLILTNTTTNMFKTIDAEGNSWGDVMSDGVRRSREVIIQGMTLEYSTGTNNPQSPALLSLDNVLNATIEDVVFKTAINTTSTTTYGIVGGGIGISIRGEGGGLESGDANLCENIQINRCKFDSLYIGVECTGTVVRPVITNSLLNNLNRGISLFTYNQVVGPSNGLFLENRFSNIIREGIYVGTSTNRTMHISENNYFIQVGNGVGLDDFVTTSTGTTPVIAFNSTGNKTINDYFHRRAFADETTSTSFYYNPVVTGRTTINDGATFTTTVATYNTTTDGVSEIAKLVLTGSDQFVSMQYQLSSPILSRKGNLIINIAPDGYASLTDTYNFIGNEVIIVENVTTSTVTHTPTQFAVDLSTYPEFIGVIGVSPYPGTPTATDGSWFIVDVSNSNNAAQITYFNTSSGSVAIFDTQSTPQILFNGVDSYTLARSISAPIALEVDTTSKIDKNYVIVNARNNSTLTETISVVEYNINILQ